MKRYTKLLAALLMLLTVTVMMVSTSFAWLTISSDPVVQGIQITLSGSHTVLVAPNITEMKDGLTCHYPGVFSDSLNFTDYDQYGYLKNVGGLLPVSTADGETWYIPAYYQQTDREVLSGEAYVGELRPTTQFIKDNMLSYANLDEAQMLKQKNGNYIYLDFWVVAPVDGYKLRVSTGAESAGSFVIDLLQADSKDDSYELTKVNQQAAASIRLGFLVNESTNMDDSMWLYSKATHFDSRYSSLRGVYSEPGTSALYMSNRFTIFEPNGDLHPTQVKDASGNPILDGQYIQTEPLGQGGIPTAISDKLTVQLKNTWHKTQEETTIAQMFRTFLAGKDLSEETGKSLEDAFYTQWLQYQIYPYVIKGNFIANTADLYKIAGIDKLAQAEEIAAMEQAGATEDVYITELIGNVPQRIRMFIWLEGQDVDCINAAATGGIAISIELAGSNQS